MVLVAPSRGVVVVAPSEAEVPVVLPLKGVVSVASLAEVGVVVVATLKGTVAVRIP